MRSNHYLQSFLEENHFSIVHAFSESSLGGVLVVKNHKLADRIENIKFLQGIEPSLKKKFLQEGKILSSLNHPAIPKVHDILEHEDTLLIRSEHIEGYSLQEVLDACKGDFPKNVATKIVETLMQALYYTHNDVRYKDKKKSVIHCDIKPSNIILSAKDVKRKAKVDEKFLSLVRKGDVKPYLIDFGIAQFKGKAQEEEGTLAYLSPAQVKNKTLDWQTDIYQLMVVYAQLLSGKQPFMGKPRSKVIESKKKEDFVVPAGIASSTKQFIEKATSSAFASEKACVRSFTKVTRKQRRQAFLKKRKKPIVGTALLIAIIVLSIVSYNLWDYQTRSVDALVKHIEPDASLEELEVALAKIQKRAFEKKYLEPLIEGKFRNIETNEPLYPSFLNANGEWVLVGPDEENAGAFVGMLFDQSDEYPEVLPYAIEYAEPILLSNFSGVQERRFQYGLIPGFEVTKDERYLVKLENISGALFSQFEMRKGAVLRTDIYVCELFLWMYEQTSDEKYLLFVEEFLQNYVVNNIDPDGYVYESSITNLTTVYGPIPDDKSGRLVTPYNEYPIGKFHSYNMIGHDEFKRVSSAFTRDHVQVIHLLYQSKGVFDDKRFDEAFLRTMSYYREKSYGVDYLFISTLNEESNIPLDALATVKSVNFLRFVDEEGYKSKLQLLLTNQYINIEEAPGIVGSNTLIEDSTYNHEEELYREQTLMITDREFLKK